MAELRAQRAERAPVRAVEGGLAISARPMVPRWALRAPADSGRHLVLAAFTWGEGDELEVLGLTVPDAHRLVQQLQRALAAS